MHTNGKEDVGGNNILLETNKALTEALKSGEE